MSNWFLRSMISGRSGPRRVIDFIADDLEDEVEVEESVRE